MNLEEKLEILKEKLDEKNKKSIYIEFVERNIEFIKDYNEEKFVLFLQVGSFFEHYSWNIRTDNFKLLDKVATETSNILHMIKSFKNSRKEHTYNNPAMFGFPCSNKERHINRLLNEGYTIILILQRDGKGKKKIRDIIEKYTPGTNIDNVYDDNYVMSIVIGEYKNDMKYCGISLINVNSNNNYFTEIIDDINNPNNVINTLTKIIIQYKPIEYLIYNLVPNNKLNNELLLNSLCIKNNYIIKDKINHDYKKQDYQLQFLNEIYSNYNMIIHSYPDARTSLILLLNYINNQNPIILKNIKFPELIKFDNRLNLDFTTSKQLNIINDENISIFSILNYTSTVMGKRLLKRRLLSPLNNKDKILNINQIIEEMIKINNYKEIELELNNIPDFYKKHKKVSYNIIKPYELYKIIKSYQNVINILKIIKVNKKLNKYISEYKLSTKNINDIITDFNNNFIINQFRFCKNIEDIEQSIIKIGNDKEVDNIMSNLNEIKNYKIKIKETLDNFFKENKIKKYETKFEKKFIYITKTKLKYLKKCNFMVNNIEYKHKKLNKKEYVYTENFLKYNTEEELLINELRERTKEYYNNYLNKLNNNDNFFSNIEKIVSNIDYIKSGVKCAIKNNYVKPEIDMEEDISYFDIKDFRHPIIEKINKDIPFVPNSLKLDKNIKCLLLSGVNSVGKSSLLKNIGIMIIIAQIGYYVPCKSMKYSPFNNILTRIKGFDNIYTNSSSFIIEMKELSNILYLANEKSLILIDELAKGTEYNSATYLTISTVKNLIEKYKSKIIITSHLSSLYKSEIIEKLKEEDKLLIKHLSIKIEDKKIIFSRKLVDGKCISEYGLKIAECVGINKDIIIDAYKIKNELNNKTNEVLPLKKSKYNSNVYIKKCELCNSEDNLETHHIIPRMKSNEKGFIESHGFHENSKHNLSILCHKCHLEITLGKNKMEQRKEILKFKNKIDLL